MKLLIPLILFLSASCASAEPCTQNDDGKRITGVSQCLLMHRYGSPEARNLLVWLHGDVSSGGPANYHFPVVQRATEALSSRSVQSIALIRPGYPDGSGDSSTVAASQAGRRDHYTRENINEIAAAIKRLKDQYHPEKLIVIGHSGGAAIAAVILGAEPGLIDGAVLVSCPCDLVAWRSNRAPWDRSENPLNWMEKTAPSARVIALTGTRDDNTPADLARRYIEALRMHGTVARFAEIAGASHNSAFKAGEVTEAIAELLAGE